MKIILLIVALSVFVVAGYCEDVLSSKLESIDIGGIMKGGGLLHNHFGCLIEGKGCTPETEELKKHIPEFIENCCEKCSDKHKEDAKKMTLFLLDNKPEYVKRMLDEYDPDRKYIGKCEEILKEGGVDLTSF